MPHLKSLLSKILVLVLFTALWALLTESKYINPLFLSTPNETITELINLFLNENIISDIIATLSRALIGFGLASIFGIFLGLIFGYFTRIYDSFEFLIDFFRSIPATALFPLFLLVFGIGDEAKIAITFWAASFFVILNTIYGVRFGSKIRVRAGKLLKLSNFDLFWKIILPQAMPQIFAGMRVALSYCLVLAVVTEMFIGGRDGLGKRIIDSQLVYNIPTVYATILIAGSIGYSLNLIFSFVEKKVVFWNT